MILMCRQNKNSELVLSLSEDGKPERVLGVCGLVARLTKFGKRSNSVKLYSLLRKAVENGCRDIQFDRLPGTKAFGPGNAEQLLMTLFREFVRECGGNVDNPHIEMARIAPIEQTKLVYWKGQTHRINSNVDVEKFIRDLGRKRAKSGSMKDTGIIPAK